MKYLKLVALALAALMLLPAALLARDIPALVSTEWLEQNLSNPRLVVVDSRSGDEYGNGHVPGGRNAPLGSWAIMEGGLSNQLPDQDDLADLIGSLGIGANSLVVVVGKAEASHDQSGNARVVWTLRVAGVGNVALLDGGINKWVKEKRRVSTEAPSVEKVEAKLEWNGALVADKGYVLAAMGKRTLADIRAPEFFFGLAKSPVAERPGHIPGAVDFPPDWAFTKEGTFKDNGELERIAVGIVGADKSRGITTYCNTGILASLGWFVLSEVLGYGDVNLYDGSMQEWTKDPKAPLAAYSWK